jgi:hypothetical protein
MSTLSVSLIIIGFLLAVATIFAVDMPLVLDYPNHLARFWLLSGGDKIAPISHMYQVDWQQASTNIGVDAIAALLGNVIPYTITGKIILAASVVGPPAAAAWLNRVIFDRWHWWQLSFVVLCWTTSALLGFMSYQISLAFALGLASLDNSLPAGALAKGLARVILGFVILIVHPFGLLFYGMLLTSFAIGESWSGIFERDRLFVIVRRLVSPMLVVLAPALALLLLSPSPPGSYVQNAPFLSLSGVFRPYHLALTLASPFLTYKNWIDAVFVTPLLVIPVFSIITGRARTHTGMIMVGVIVAALALVVPPRVGDEANVDLRLPLMAALLLFTGALPDPIPARSGRVVLAMLVFALGVARTIWIGVVWQFRQQDVQSIEDALSHVPAGSSLFTVVSEPEDIRTEPIGRYPTGMLGGRYNLTLFHVTALVVPQRNAFIGTLFATRGQQPVKVLPPWNTMMMNFIDVFPDVHVLDMGPKALGIMDDPYVQNWDKRFDYVIALGMDRDDYRGPFEPPSQLRLVSDNGYARLYRIVR